MGEFKELHQLAEFCKLTGIIVNFNPTVDNMLKETMKYHFEGLVKARFWDRKTVDEMTQGCKIRPDVAVKSGATIKLNTSALLELAFSASPGNNYEDSFAGGDEIQENVQAQADLLKNVTFWMQMIAETCDQQGQTILRDQIRTFVSDATTTLATVRIRKNFNLGKNNL